jgi:hypothetical protein
MAEAPAGAAKQEALGKTVVGAAAEPPMAASRDVVQDAARDAGRARAVAPAAAPAPLAAKEADVLPPGKWLERIEALRKEGKLDEAAKSLAEFRKRYPDYVLPAHLKDGIRP